MMGRYVQAVWTVAVVGLLLLVPVQATHAAALEVKHESGTTVVPVNPQRVVVFDFGTLDTLHVLDIPIVGLPKSNLPSYLSEYNDARYTNLGTLKEPDFERMYALKPDLIIISGRQAELYDEFRRIAPTIHLDVDQKRYVESVSENIRLLGRIFQKEAEVEKQLQKLTEQITGVQNRVQAAPPTALITLVNDTAVSVYGPGSRFGVIHDVLGFKPVDERIAVSTHGQTISFEFILTKDPEYLFVVDRNKAVGNGTSSAKAVIENQLVRYTKAYKNGNIVYLDPEYWYLADGGLRSVSAMVAEIAAALN